jgi:hypothetical protein
MKKFSQSESTWKRDLRGITRVLERVGTRAGADYRPTNKRLGGWANEGSKVESYPPMV